MKVAHIITGLKPGGAEMTLYRLSTAHQKMGINSMIYSLKSNGELKSQFESSGISVKDMNFSSKKINVIALIQLIRELKSYNPDIIQCWMYHANIYGLLAGKIAGKYPILWNIRNSTLDTKTSSKFTILFMKVGGWLSSFPELIISCSINAKDVHIKEGYREDKFVVIPNGIDVSIFAPDKQKREALREQLGINKDNIAIGIVGRYSPQKDFLTFLEAAKRLVEKDRKYKFILCGYQVDENNPRLVKALSNFNLQGHAFLLGHQTTMSDIYPSMDVLISTSAYGEAFPNVLAEAMACGVPCVATDVGDASYIVADTGKIVPVKNPDAVVEGIEELFALSSVEMEKMKSSARSRIVNNFSLPEIVKTYKETYERIGKSVKSS